MIEKSTEGARRHSACVLGVQRLAALFAKIGCASATGGSAGRTAGANRTGAPRQVCRLKTSAGEDAADLMLSEGLAGYPETYSGEDFPVDRERYRSLEAEAIAAKRGVWSEPDPMQPKECRQRWQAGLKCR